MAFRSRVMGAPGRRSPCGTRRSGLPGARSRASATGGSEAGRCPGKDRKIPLAIYTEGWIVEVMSLPAAPTRVLSVTEASARGVAGLLKDSEHGTDTVVERHGRPGAAVVSIEHFSDLRELEQDLCSAALGLSRAATDSGHRTDLDDVIATFGFSREDLQQERLDDAAAARE